MPEYKLKLYRGTWCAYWREGGQPQRRSMRTGDLAEATRRLADWRAQEAVSDDPTIEAIWSAYVADHEPRPIAKAMRWEWAVMAPSFGHLLPHQITREVVQGHIAARRLSGVGDGTLWTELGHLRGALSWAVKRGLIDRAPHVERPSKPPPRDAHLSREEAARLIEACVAPHVRLFVILALQTAGRRSALLELTWDRVDFARGLIRLATPGHERRKGRATVPMAPSLRAALSEAYAARTCDHVIEHGGRPVRSVRTGIEGAARRAGLTDFHVHDLRHTAAVWMAEGGVPMSEIAQVLGHSDSRLTERVYGRYSPEYLSGAVAHLEINPLRRRGG